MTCPKSFALGRWRGAQGRPSFVALADGICRESYQDGHAAGREEAAERDRQRRNKGRR